MTDDELRAIIAAEIAHCDTNDTESEARELALKYYHCDPDAGILANRGEGRSSVVASAVRDTVETALPSLMRIFTAGDKVCAFEPVGAEDIEAAEQETAVVNHVVMKDNRGFEILYSKCKDALLSRRGIVKVWWEETEETERDSYEGLTPEEYESLKSDEEVTVIDETERKPAGQSFAGQLFPWWTPSVYDLTVERTAKSGRVKIENIPPEEFLVATRARDDMTAPFLGHRSKKTVSELLDMGFKQSDIDKIPDYDDLGASERDARRVGSNAFAKAPNLDDSMREVVVIECHLLVDFDGDGRAERRKVIVGGNAADVLLSNEEVGDHPFATICPLPMPHRPSGLSLADLAEQSQVTETVIWRNTLDNFYAVNNSRMEIAEAGIGDNTIDDLLNVRPAGVVRTAQPGMLKPLETKSVLGESLTMMEFLATVRENRTGITRYNQGLDANSLNKTATGVQLIQNAAMQRLELIARNFAETGIKRMFLLVHDLLRQHSEKTIPFLMRGEWIEVDPRKFRRRMDMTAQVGLGTGNKEQQLVALDGMLQIQQGIATAQGGLNGPVITWKHLFNTLEKRIAVAELGAPDQFAQDPENAPPPPPQPNPEVEKAQAELQIKAQGAQQDAQIEQQKAQANLMLEQQKAQQEMALAEQRLQHEMKLEEMRLQHEMRLATLKAQAEMAVKQRTAEMNMAVTAATAMREEPAATESKQ